MMGRQRITAFAPATLSNLGPGFDILGAALEEPGDTVTLEKKDVLGVVIARIEGDGAELSRDANINTAGIAAQRVLEMAEADFGVELTLKKGLPLGSGLGSSAASAAAAAFAANQLLEKPLPVMKLVEIGIEAEAAVSGRHADNVAPALLGGVVLVRSLDPIDLISIPVPKNLPVVVVKPAIEIATKMARDILPQVIPLRSMVLNSGNVAAMIAAFHSGDMDLLSRSMIDHVVEPVRAALIPGFDEVKQAALKSGALACSISGSGPALFAFCPDRKVASAVSSSMSAVFSSKGLNSMKIVTTISSKGARVVK
jgi:homoserine kinase